MQPALSHIQIKDMETGSQYNKLKTESRLFMNVLRMIAYRAETSIVNLLDECYSKTEDEGRMVVKDIIKTDADLKPDYESKTLAVSLHSLSTPRANRVVERLCQFLNETETVFPGTDLRLIYQTLSEEDNHTGLLLPAGLDCCDIPFVNK